MATLRFLHTSDWQLGMRRWFLNTEAQARFDVARITAVRKLGDLAREHNCAFIVVAGDVFEHNSLEAQTFGRALEALKTIPVPVLLLPGNHDPLTADSMVRRAGVLDHVSVLEDTSPVKLCDGVEVIGAPWPSKHVTRDLVADAIAELSPSDTIRVVVGHGQVENRSGGFAPELIDLKNLEQAYQDRRIDYVALGDTHSAQPVGSSEVVWFSGSPETTDYHERGEGGQGDGGEHNSGHALLVTVSKEPDSTAPATVEVEPVIVGTWVFDAVDWELFGRDDVDAFISFLQSYPNKEETVIKYALRGTVDAATMEHLEVERTRLEPVFAALYERQRLTDLKLTPSEDDLAEFDLGGFAGEALEELSTRAGSDPTAQDALRLLFRLAKED